MRIVIADDHAWVRKGIRAMFAERSDWEVCGEATNGREAVKLALALKPELVVLDISMPELTGFQAAKEIRRLIPQIKIIILSMHESAHAKREALSAGADAYFTKTEDPLVLVAAIEALIRNGTGRAASG